MIPFGMLLLILFLLMPQYAMVNTPRKVVDPPPKKPIRVVDSYTEKPIEGALVTSGNDVERTDGNGMCYMKIEGNKVAARACGYLRFEEIIPTPQEKKPRLLTPKAICLSVYGIVNKALRENGEVKNVGGLKIEAVPAYNLVHMRSEGKPFHPKGEGNGYVITFGDKRVYVAGDTENIPEMKKLEKIDVAFLPMNLPFTMTPEMVADAAKAFKPRVLYPYHFGETDTSKLLGLLKESKEIEVRIRKMK